MAMWANGRKRYWVLAGLSLGGGLWACSRWFPLGERSSRRFAVEALQTARPLGHLNDPTGELRRRFAADTLVAVADAVSDRELATVLESLSLRELETPFGRRWFERWAQMDPRAATWWACRCGERSLRAQLTRIAVTRWANADFNAATAWGESLPNGNESREFVLAILSSNAVEDRPVTALRLALELSDDNARRLSLASTAAAAWTKVDAAAASAWVRGQPGGELRDRLVSAVALSWAETDASSSLHFLFENLIAGEAQDQTAISIVQHAGSAAPAVLAAFSNDTLRAQSFPFVIALWSACDPTAAGAWLKTLDADALYDAGAAAYARVLAGRAEPGALAWARTIRDPKVREQTVEYAAALLR